MVIGVTIEKSSNKYGLNSINRADLNNVMIQKSTVVLNYNLTRQTAVAIRTRALFHFDGHLLMRAPIHRRVHGKVTERHYRHVAVVSGTDQDGVKRSKSLKKSLSGR